MSMPDWEPLGESALLLRWGQRIDAALNAHVHAAAAAIGNAALPAIEDIVPAYASLLLRFDARHWSRDGTRDAHTALRACIEPLLSTTAPDVRRARTLRIPVVYGGDSGPDLDALARTCGMDAQTFVARHTAPLYRVAMLGFAPGFPYLLGLDAALYAPRRASPRVRVPAGSVAIGGAQTGIYPSELPGGWQLIGRTPLRLFDPRRAPPCLLRAGDHVRFVALAAEAPAHTDRGAV